MSIRSFSRFTCLAARLTLLVTLAWFISLDRNPIVRLEAVLGLSPSPLEKLFGVKGLFSGMTEGMHRLVYGDITGALAANVLTPLFAIIVLVCGITGYKPRIRTRRQEWIFLLAAVGFSALVNFVN
jgi:hypothetical protein